MDVSCTLVRSMDTYMCTYINHINCTNNLSPDGRSPKPGPKVGRPGVSGVKGWRIGNDHGREEVE